MFIGDDGAINCKIVYWGPNLSGRSTNLRQLYNTVDSARRGQLISLRTESESCLFFNYVVDGVAPGGRPLRLHLYTVTGARVYADDFYLQVLRGLEAIVFVADSQLERLEACRESYGDLLRFLELSGRRAEEELIVFQYSKRDLENALPIATLERELNPQGRPHLAATPVAGEGVCETAHELTRRIVARLRAQAAI